PGRARARVRPRGLRRPARQPPSEAASGPPGAGAGPGMKKAAAVEIPRRTDDAEVAVGRRRVKLTNLRKVFWPALGVTKGDLLRYYADISPWLLPHVADRAMVMKRYPHGAEGEFFFMKRAPSPRPEWIRTCAVEHGSGSVIDFPVVDDLATLL